MRRGKRDNSALNGNPVNYGGGDARGIDRLLFAYGQGVDPHACFRPSSPAPSGHH